MKDFGSSIVLGKPPKCDTKKLKTLALPCGWKKLSIFFELSYWKTLLLRHNIDVMHTEKNVCDNILNTLLDIDNKSKDNLAARFDLEEMGIRKELHAKLVDDKYHMPSACFNLSLKQKEIFCKALHSLKLPDGYSSNISRCVKLKERSIKGMKSHDCHMLMQQLLPLALCKSTNPNVASVLIDLCKYFNVICSKTINVSHMEQLEKEIVITLCKLETLFPPSFFTIMVHLTVHLATEVKLAGPVQYRWMYPVERCEYFLPLFLIC